LETTKGPTGPSIYRRATVALEALFAVAVFAVSFVGLVWLHLVALICFVTSDSAASRRSQNSVMSSKMARYATDDRAFKTALCVS
jgi:hypothetical protein